MHTVLVYGAGTAGPVLELHVHTSWSRSLTELRRLNARVTTSQPTTDARSLASNAALRKVFLSVWQTNGLDNGMMDCRSGEPCLLEILATGSFDREWEWRIRVGLAATMLLVKALSFT
jgi:hypothetical protein